MKGLVFTATVLASFSKSERFVVDTTIGIVNPEINLNDVESAYTFLNSSFKLENIGHFYVTDLFCKFSADVEAVSRNYLEIHWKVYFYKNVKSLTERDLDVRIKKYHQFHFLRYPLFITLFAIVLLLTIYFAFTFKAAINHHKRSTTYSLTRNRSLRRYPSRQHSIIEDFSDTVPRRLSIFIGPLYDTVFE